jgi:hypothetical protein
MTDTAKGAKIHKPKHADKVAVHPDLPETEPAGETTGVGEQEPVEAPLTDAEKAEAASEAPKVEPLAPVIPPTYLVEAGGRAWYRGQQIKFTTGEVFTSETWDEHAIAGFRECGVTITRTH